MSLSEARSKQVWKQLGPLLRSSFQVTSSRLPTLRELGPITSWKHEEARFAEDTRLRFLKAEYICHSHILLTQELVAALGSFVDDFDRAAELACGPGWLTYWLWRYGCRSLQDAVDDESGTRSAYHSFVCREDALSYLRRTPGISLYILVWPPPNALAFELWEALRPGQSLLYIGEVGGCTAEERFDRVVRQESRADPKMGLLRKVHRSLPGAEDDIYLLQKD